VRRRDFLGAAIGLAGGFKNYACAWAAQDPIRQVEEGLKGPSGTASIQQQLAFHKVPGASVAVIHRGRIAWAKGYGLTAAHGSKRVNKQTLFQAASISKPVTAMAALRLVQQGKLTLDEAVNKRLRSWKISPSQADRGKAVTLRMLLSHSAGMNVHGFGGYPAGKPLPSLLQVLDGKPPANSPAIRVVSEPGTKFEYSGGGFCIVQQLIKDVTGKPFPAAMHELVLGPIGMKASTYEEPIPPARASSAASGHDDGGTMIPGHWHIHPEMAAAGLWTTPEDLALFAIELANAFAGRSNRVLTAETARAMLHPQKGGWGLGIRLTGAKPRAFSHNGANAGYCCLLICRLDSGDGAIIMTNGDQGDRLYGEILQSISRTYSWPS
jgi:CubicO group peptidase (beta-lactamase class C family)